ncbi:MAG: caspase family protein [Bacteroidia bacterium]|nr:caspase family protein [Bacteroidia bacterium]
MWRRLILFSVLSGIWVTAAGQFGFNVKKTFGEANHQIYFASFTPDGNYIITSGSDNNVIIWNAEKGTIYKTLTGLKSRQNAAVFSPDKSALVSAGEDNIITVWNPEAASIAGNLKGHTGPVKTLDISPDGRLLASGGTDKSVFIWDLKQNTLLFELKGHRKDVNVVRFSPDGKILASGGGDNTVILWNTTSWSIIKSKQIHNGWVRDLEFNPDGTVIASCGYDGMIYTSSVPDLNIINSFKGHKEWVQTIDYSPDGKYLLSGGHDQMIILWDAATGKILSQSAKQGQIVLTTEFSPLHPDFISASLHSEKLDTWVLSGVDETQWIATTEKTTITTTSDNQPIIKPQKDGVLRNNAMMEIFSPVATRGRVTHDKSSILIVGRVSDPVGINTFLIDKNLIKLSEGGIFQFNHDLVKGENIIALVAINNKGIMNEQKLIIDCTADNANVPGVNVPEIAKGKYYALLIGINEYQSDEISDLDNPVKDAESLFNVLLSKYTFEKDHVIFLKNPTRGEIIMAFDNFKKKLTPNDNLLIFYAGHGNWDEKGKVGYWLPSDALKSNSVNWYSNSSLRDDIGSIQTKHTILIADACFSGAIFKSRAAFTDTPRGIEKLYELSSRKAITSGILQEVPDESMFIKYLVERLDENEERFLPSEILFSSFKQAVMNNSPNVPQYGVIQNVGDEGGDFIFIRK